LKTSPFSGIIDKYLVLELAVIGGELIYIIVNKKNSNKNILI